MTGVFCTTYAIRSQIKGAFLCSGDFAFSSYLDTRRFRRVRFDNEHCASTFTPQPAGVSTQRWEAQLLLAAGEHLATVAEDADVVVLSDDPDIKDMARRSGSSVSVLSVSKWVQCFKNPLYSDEPNTSGGTDGIHVFQILREIS